MNDYIWNLNSDDYLAHFGVKGMQWGRRRYQYQDGTYTPLGKQRRMKGSRHRESRAEWSDDHKNAHTRRNINSMSTKELQALNQRLQAEQQYKQLTSSKKKTDDKNSVGNIVLNRILIPAVTGMAVSRIQKYGGKYLDKAIEPWIDKLDEKLGVE